MTDPAAGLAIAADAAQASRDLLQGGRRGDPRSLTGRDIKLAEDIASETLIVAALRARSDLPIFSEEAGWVDGVRAAEGQQFWAVDPLDGSFNFQRGIPLCCTSVALCVGLTALAGAVFDFNRDELFAGGADLPLTLNGAPLVPAAESYGVLATGLPVRGDFAAERMQALATRFLDWRKVRMLGSAALSLAWVAAGRLDAYEEAGISWYDVAGGLALVAAGGGSGEALGDAVEAPLSVRARSAGFVRAAA